MADIMERLKVAIADRYVIERELGQGGMATVYLAQDIKHKRKVALKVLRPELAAALGHDRFVREIEITASLTHPHILPVLESGEADGMFFYVMPFVEGESLRERLNRDRQLSVDDALSIAEEVGEALESAHRHGVVHRDVKPDNILLKEGRVYVADFGIARAVSAAGGERLTATGLAVGTPAYMSPEQASGDDVDQRTDIFALACVLYEMLAGEPPHSGPTVQAVIAKILTDPPTRLSALRNTVPPHVERAVHRALAKSPADRFATMDDLLHALRTPDVTPADAAPRAASRLTALAKRLAVPVAVGLAAVAVIIMWTSGPKRPTLEALRSAVDARDHEAAYQLATQMNAAEIPDSLWSTFTTPVTIHSSPAGATVQRRAYENADAGPWESLGTTPLTIARFPLSPSVLRLEAEGYRTIDVATGRQATADTIVLSPLASLPERWRHVPGPLPGYAGGPEFAFRYVAPNLSLAPPLLLQDFQLGQYEVTNAEYKQFIDAGGYRDRAYWEHPFKRDGRAVPWEDAMQAFTDSTGRPGPSTWSFGSYRDGQGEYPVTGVSWYEAAAYARFSGKELPTVYHWFRAATTWHGDWIIPASNMAAAAPKAVGSSAGMSQFGIYDMAGNAREWAFNASGDERYILGGGWADDPYVFTVANSAPPFDRSSMNGFRLASYGENVGNLSATRRRIEHAVRDFARETPVSDAVFQVYKRLYAYDREPLDVVSRSIDTTETWVREYVTFRAAYGNERVGLYLYTPRSKPGPFQTVVYFPGSNALLQDSFEDYSTEHAEMIVRSGRAFAFPVYQSTFDRNDGFVYRRQDETNTYRDHVLHWAKDLGRSLDYLETRADIDAERFAYLGYSWGGMLAPIMLSTEPRFKVAVLGLPGLSPLPTQPEVDAFHFVGRATQPVLMLSGEYDMIHPLETTARPLFALWNAPEDRKRHVVARGGHQVPYYVMVQETLAWLDRFLGPI